MKIREITGKLEKLAPASYQESYDNSGLLIGNNNADVSGVLISLDVTEDIIEEAIKTGCNLIVAHHPLIFKGLKRINGNHWVERCIIKAIKNDIAIYAIHTNLDNVTGGVNSKIAEKLGLVNTSILAPKTETLSKLVTFVPTNHKDELLTALYDAGVGQVGQYDHCSFQTEGTGTFRPGENTNAFIGESGKDEEVKEIRLELIFADHLTRKVLSTLKKNHPYEEVAYYLTKLSNKNQDVGSGRVGELPTSVPTEAFLKHLKSNLNTQMIRHTALCKTEIKKVAVCGGAGSFLLEMAKSTGADIFITGDFKYHEFFEADGDIIIADVGHYESEQFTKELIAEKLTHKDIQVVLSKINTNPVNYY